VLWLGRRGCCSFNKLEGMKVEIFAVYGYRSRAI
jgi:hypothetical protein